MSDYTEHLISMAGGDGDPLDAIQRRVDNASPGPWVMNEDSYHVYDAHDYMVCADLFDSETAEFIAHARHDVPTLLNIARVQAATLAAVLSLANTSGRCGWRISADELRRTLRGES